MKQNKEGQPPQESHPCAGCLHFYGVYQNNICCNYIFDMDRRRPCPFGKGCTVKRPIQSPQDYKLRKAKFYI